MRYIIIVEKDCPASPNHVPYFVTCRYEFRFPVIGSRSASSIYALEPAVSVNAPLTQTFAGLPERLL